MAPKSSDRRGTRISLIAIHTNEGPNPADVFPDRTAENLARWMDGQNVSYHKIVDDDSVVHYVPDERYSWSLRSGNARSLNLCFTGYARWSREEWLRHQRMLQQGADIVREWCRRWRIPVVKLSSAEVGRDFAGIIGHVNWTEGKRDGSHTDPGSNFPWDVFMNMVRGDQMEDDMPGWHEPLAKDWAGNPQTLRGTFDHIDRRTVELEKKVDHLTRRLDETATAIVGMHQELMAALKSSHGEPVDPS